jgi:hypothetical protein
MREAHGHGRSSSARATRAATSPARATGSLAATGELWPAATAACSTKRPLVATDLRAGCHDGAQPRVTTGAVRATGRSFENVPSTNSTLPSISDSLSASCFIGLDWGPQGPESGFDCPRPTDQPAANVGNKCSASAAVLRQPAMMGRLGCLQHRDWLRQPERTRGTGPARLVRAHRVRAPADHRCARRA